MAKKILYGVLSDKGILTYVDEDIKKVEKMAGPGDEVVPLEKVDNSEKKL